MSKYFNQYRFLNGGGSDSEPCISLVEVFFNSDRSMSHYGEPSFTGLDPRHVLKQHIDALLEAIFSPVVVPSDFVGSLGDDDIPF